MGELIAVEPVQPVLRAHPQKTPAVLCDAVDGALGKALVSGKMLETDLLGQQGQWEKKKRQKIFDYAHQGKLRTLCSEKFAPHLL